VNRGCGCAPWGWVHLFEALMISLPWNMPSHRVKTWLQYISADRPDYFKQSHKWLRLSYCQKPFMLVLTWDELTLGTWSLLPQIKIGSLSRKLQPTSVLDLNIWSLSCLSRSPVTRHALSALSAHSLTAILRRSYSIEVVSPPIFNFYFSTEVLSLDGDRG
jgi:hypothetical protein